MSRLLVSVRDAAEARIALDSGVDLIDLKEPARGSLGRIDDAVAREVVSLVGGRVPLSMALGELVDYFPNDETLIPSCSLGEIPTGIGFVKLGLAGCATRRHWGTHWKLLSGGLPRAVERVFVAYIDTVAAQAPATGNVLEQAARLGARALLLDTAVKDGRGLLDHITPQNLDRFVRDVHREKLLAVVGGGLTLETIGQVADCGADYIAVRGAACEGDRNGNIDAERIRKIKKLLSRA